MWVSALVNPRDVMEMHQKYYSTTVQNEVYCVPIRQKLERRLGIAVYGLLPYQHQETRTCHPQRAQSSLWISISVKPQLED